MRGAANHLDRRRLLVPSAYFAEPAAFGVRRGAVARLAPGGDEVSAMVAQLQHELVVAWRARGCRPSGAALAGRFGFSKQTWSRTVLGQRWMGETVLVVLIRTLQDAPGRRGSRPSASPPG